MSFFDKLIREIDRVGKQLVGGGLIPDKLKREQGAADRQAQEAFDQQQALLNQQENLGELEVQNAASSPMIEVGGTARRQRRRSGGSVSGSLGL